jgi:hypothetical protein
MQVLWPIEAIRSLEMTQPRLPEDEEDIILELDILTPIATQAPEVTIVRMSECRHQIVIWYRHCDEYRS